MRQAIRMLESAIHQGITHVLCTPHANDHSNSQANELFQDRLAALNAEMANIELPFELGFGDMALIILQLIVFPLVVGMLLNARFPNTVAKIRPWVQRLSLALFFTILALAIVGNLKNMADYLGFVFVLVAVHNLAGISAGYGLGRLARLPSLDCRTLAFESGVHNTALGLLLIFRFFNGLGGMAR